MTDLRGCDIRLGEKKAQYPDGFESALNPVSPSYVLKIVLITKKTHLHLILNQRLHTFCCVLE